MPIQNFYIKYLGSQNSVLPILVTKNTTNVNINKALHNFHTVEASLSPFQVPYKRISNNENYFLGGMVHDLIQHTGDVPSIHTFGGGSR